MENTYTEIAIHQNALTEDTIAKCKAGYRWKGRAGAIYKITYYTYANCWGDREHAIYAKTLENALKNYQKATGRLTDIQDDEGTTTEDLALEIEHII